MQGLRVIISHRAHREATSWDLIANLAHPGGNITGLSSLTYDLEMKRYQLLKELLPGVKRVGNVNDPSSPIASGQWSERARSLGIEVRDLDVQNIADLSRAFDLASKERVEALRFGLSGIARTNQRLSLTWQHNTSCPRFIKLGSLLRTEYDILRRELS